MTTYYVATTGDDGDPGTESEPWATPQHAADTARDGDIVIFKDGTWNLTAQIDYDQNSGSSGNEITFRAQNSRLAIWKRAWNGSAVVYVNQEDYITFNGIVIDGDYAVGGRTGSWAFRLGNADHITIIDCGIKNIQGWGVHAVNGCADLTIEDTDINLGFYGAGNTYDAIYLDDSDNPNLIIRNVTAQYTDHAGFNIARAANFLIEDCTVHDTHSHGIQFGDPTESAPAGSISGTAQRNKVSNVERFHPEPQSHNAFFTWADSVGDVTIQLNEIYNVDCSGVHIRADVTGPVKIYNNSIYNHNENEGEGDTSSGIHIWAPGSESPTIEVKNNIIYNVFDGGRTVTVTGTNIEDNLDMDYNLYYAPYSNGEEIKRGGATYSSYTAYQTAGYEPNTEVGSDPLFNDAPAGDFTLEGGSPAIDAGTDVGLPYFGSAPDIGAHEFGTAVVDGSVTLAGSLALALSTTKAGTLSFAGVVTADLLGPLFEVKVKDPPTGHAALFATGDILRVRALSGATVRDNWLKVFGVSDPGSDYFTYSARLESGAAGVLPRGSAIFNYGQSGDGILQLVGKETNGPHLLVATHAGEPWTTITRHAQIGNLNGILGLSADEWGIAAGEDLSSTSVPYILVTNATAKAFLNDVRAATGMTIGSLTLGASVGELLFAGTGDLQLRFFQDAANRWTMGVDDSDSNAFKICQGNVLGGSFQRLMFTTDGQAGMSIADGDQPQAWLHIIQHEAAAAVAVLRLEQDDLDNPMIDFIGDVQDGGFGYSLVDENDVTTPTRVVWVRCYMEDRQDVVTDGVLWMPLYSLA